MGRILLTAVLVLLGCDSADDPPADAHLSDVLTTDAALTDAAPLDAALLDVAFPDMRVADAAVPDMAAPDAYIWPVPSGPVVGVTLCIASGLPGAGSADVFYERLEAAGIRAIRGGLHWARVEPERGVFNFDSTDAKVEAAIAHGVEVTALLGYGNPWASVLGAENNDQFYPPDDPEDFARFAAAMVERYGDRIQRWEIWNEQNAGYRFWKRPRQVNGDAVAYGALLTATYAAMKAVDPDALVAFGGLFYLPQLIQGAEDFMREAYEAHPELGASFDALAYHPYDFYAPTRPPEYRGAIGVIELYPVDETARRMAALVEAEEGRSKPLWVTEVGWPTEGGVSADDQARYLVRAHLLLVAQGVERVCAYTLRDGSPDREYLAPQERVFGLYTYEGEPKPAVRALATMRKVLGELRFVANRRTDDAYLMAFGDGTRRVWVAWTVEGEATVTLPEEAGRRYSTVDFMGGAPAASDGTVLAGPNPVYILDDPE